MKIAATFVESCTTLILLVIGHMPVYVLLVTKKGKE